MRRNQTSENGHLLRSTLVPGRLVNHSGRRKLRLPSQWPWATAFTTALQRIRNLPQLI